jgi:PAS domain S-box-containing protein
VTLVPGTEPLGEELAMALLDAAPVALLLVDSGARIVFANRRTEATFGHARAELVGQPLTMIVADRRWETIAADPATLESGPVTYGAGDDRPLVGRRRDGDEFPAEVSLGAVPGPRGPIVAVAVHERSDPWTEDLVERRRTKDALHRSETNFRALFDQAPEGVFIADIDGRCTDVNAAACQMLGCEREDIVGRTVVDILPGDDAPRLIDAREASLAPPGWVEVWEWTLKRRDGALIPVEVTAKTLPDGRWQAFVRDISRRKQREEDLRRVSSLLDSIIENVPAMIFLKSATSLRFERFNRAGEELLGVPRESLLGMNDFDLFTREQAEFFQARDRETLNERKLVVIPEEPIRTAAGTRWLHTRKIPIMDGVGTPAYLLGISMDITDSLRAEHERAASLRWLRAVLDQSPVGLILVHGSDGARVDANRRAVEMVGEPLGPIDRHLELLAAPDGQPIHPDSLPSTRALRGEKTEGVELRLRTARGESIPILASSAPIVGLDGTVQGAVVAFQDIRAAKELEHLRAEWGSIVAHDLRQPLQSVVLSTRILGIEMRDPALEKYVERIRSSAERLNRMVADLMDFSSLDARRLELVRRPVDVTAVVRGSVELMALQAPDRPFDVTAPEEALKADADPDRIAQVMENLLTNAVKYGTSKSPIVVGITHEDHDIAVAVTNEGKALAPEELPRLFERFHRTEGAKQGAAKGAGLGLYITRALVEAHGGRITAESTPAGRTTFRFTLPVVK